MKTLVNDIVKVGIADLKFADVPMNLRTSGLGSCVGVVIFDHRLKIAGMAHVMLPDSTSAKKDNINPYKYADTSLPILLNTLLEKGARRHHLKAKIAGGAQMFSFSSTNDMLRVGERNVQAVKSFLEDERIPILAEDVRGSSGRTIEFSTETLLLNVRTVNQGTKDL